MRVLAGAASRDDELPDEASDWRISPPGVAGFDVVAIERLEYDPSRTLFTAPA